MIAQPCFDQPQVKAAYGLAAAPGQVAAACSNGLVRFFSAKSLEFRGTLPRLLPRGGAAVAGFAQGGWRTTSGGGGAGCVDPGALRESVFPDAVGCAFSACGGRLVVTYRDRSLVMWDVARPASVSCVATSVSCMGVVLGFSGGWVLLECWL